MLENWCERNGIDASKVDERLFDQIVGMMEQEIDDFVEDNKDKLLANHTFLITQELEEHPEWRKKDERN